MYLRTPTATPLIGVLLVVFIAVSTDWRLLTIEVPRTFDGISCGPLEDRGTEFRVVLRPDLSASIRNARVVGEVGPTGFAQLLRTAVDAITPDDAPAPWIVISLEADEDVRWGDLVSTIDTIHGVAPEASIALLPHEEPPVEAWQ